MLLGRLIKRKLRNACSTVPAEAGMNLDAVWRNPSDVEMQPAYLKAGRYPKCTGAAYEWKKRLEISDSGFCIKERVGKSA